MTARKARLSDAPKGIDPADLVESIAQSAKLLKVEPAALERMLRKSSSYIPPAVKQRVKQMIRERLRAARATAEKRGRPRAARTTP
jgi:hypothetical protein